MAWEEKRAFAARLVQEWVSQARRVAAMMLGLVALAVSMQAYAQCPHCNPESAHSPQMCRYGTNPVREVYAPSDGSGGLSVADVLGKACHQYAQEHSSEAYLAVWQRCTPRLPAPNPQDFGGTWASFSVDGLLLKIERASGKIVSRTDGGWSLATCSCWDSVRPHTASIGATGQCYCKGTDVWDAARQTCVPKPVDPLRIELEGDSVTRAAPVGPSLAQRAVVRRAGAPVAGVAVSIAIQGQGTLQGVTDAAGQFHFTYVPPRGKARDTVTGACTGCENTALKPIEVQAPGVEMCPAEPGTLIGNPILAATGEKVHFEQDYADGAPHPLDFGRSYRSQGGWRHTYEARLEASAGARVVSLGDGSLAVFTLRNGAWVSDNGDTLVPHATGSTYRKAREDRRWEFDTAGRLVALVQANGWTMGLAYDAARRLASVTNAFGRRLVFTHDAEGKLQAMQAPDGQAVRYGWAGENLLSVTHADNTVRRYHYEDARHAGALTGITDEAGQRIATYGYDEAGRAISTGVPGLAGYSVAYGQAAAPAAQMHGTIVAGAAPPAASQAQQSSLSVTDPLGASRNHAFTGGQGRIGLQVSDGPHDGVDWATRVLGAGLLPVEEVDFLGVVTRSGWDGRGLRTHREEAAGRPEARVTSTQWHPVLRLPLLVTEPGRTTAFTYDGRGNRLSETVTDTASGEARISRWTYTAQGLVETYADPRGATWRYEYDGAGNQTAETDPQGRTTRYAHDAAGRVTAVTQANGLVITYGHDARGRVVSLSRGGEAFSFGYTATGLPSRVALPNGNTLDYTYDTAGRLVAVQDGHGTRTEYQLDAMGNRIGEAVKDALGNVALALGRHIGQFNRVVALRSASGHLTQLGYDANGEPVSQTDPLGHSTREALDALRRPVATVFPDRSSAQQAWNALDSLTQVTDPKGVRTAYTVNAFEEATAEASPDIGQVTMKRDAAGALIESTDAKGETRRIVRDALGRPLEIRYADGRTAAFEYDAEGEVRSVRDASGETTFTRDLHGRIIQGDRIVGDSGTSASRFRTIYTYAGGELVQVTLPSGLKIVYRRVAGRIVGIDIIPPGKGKAAIPFITNLVHTPLGVPRSWTFSNGRAVERTFDLDGRMTATEFAAYSYDAAGRMTGIVQQLWADGPKEKDKANTVKGGDQGLAGLYTVPLAWRIGYDSRSRLTDFVRDGAEVHYTYDANGNRLTALETVSGDIDLDGDYEESGFSIRTSRVMDVEPDSNRLLGFTQTVTKTRDGNTYGTATTPVAYTVDANGALTSDGLRTFEYDSAGRLSRVRIGQGEEAASVSYLHNALGQRVFKSEVQTEQTMPSEEQLGQGFVAWLKSRFGWMFNQAQATTSVGTAYVYGDGPIPTYALMGEYDNGSATGKGRTEYIWLPMEGGLAIPVGIFRNGRLFAIHTDHLATPRLVTDDAGAPVWQWAYSAFGDNKPTGMLKAATNPKHATTNSPVLLKATKPEQQLDLRYPGQYFDTESGFNYNTNRMYDSLRGRYTQFDPIGLRGGPNGYVYAGANPLTFTDPMGLKHKASSAHCKALQKKIDNLMKNLDDRWADLAEGGLPERLANPKNEPLSATMRGHRTLINDRDSVLRKWEKRYSDECEPDDPPSGGTCDECTAGAVAATMVGGYLVYRCVRMLPSLLPPLWWTIPANAVTP